jgi:alanine dehydrogenase
VASFLADNDIVVNCVLQDPGAPLIFVTEDDLQAFVPGALLVGVSCDEGMGFSWARTSSFTEPVIEVGNGVHYYAVDHSPSYLWNSATWEIRDGIVQNPAILSFQHRGRTYPHAVMTPARIP